MEEGMNDWQTWSKTLQEVLSLARAPVAVSYTDSPAENASTGRCRVCSGIFRAAAGEVLDLTAENSACPGGSLYLGLRPQPPEQAETLREFLINGEKLFSCPAAIHRSWALSKVKPPLGMAKHVVLCPLAKSELKPDVTIFLCNAWQAARLVSLAWYETGMPMECDPTGALCKSVITYPLITGQVNVSLGDITARKSERMSENELFVTLPYVHLRSTIDSIDRCGAGRAKVELPPSMRQMIEASGGEPPEL
jgi:uncharacterized protein (DUF169 family)